MKYYIKAFIHYAVFSTRANRAEYWYFVLFSFIVSILLLILGVILETDLLPAVYNLIALVPSLAVAVRRMHDIDKSGWWILVNLLPIVGWIIFIYLAVQKGTEGPNRFGQPPEVLMENDL